MDTCNIGRSLVLSVGCRNETLYSTLPESGVIRLVKILSGDWDEEIVCDIFETSLGTIMPYKALSYAWRLVQVPVVLWVDFLCINQQDVVERSLQVAMMREIYEKSREVIIWLGEGSKYDRFEERGRGQRPAQLTKRARVIEWYDDERDSAKVDSYSQAFENISLFSSTSAKEVYGAFCTIYLLSRGVPPRNIRFLNYLSLATDTVSGLKALMSETWVRSISLNFHASYS
jgi:hypothetical protein